MDPMDPSMMEQQQVVVKAEMQGDEQILLFYVDENGANEESVLTTVEHINHEVDLGEQQNIYIEEEINNEIDEQDDFILPNDENISPDYNDWAWSEMETKRLLVFYIDNKETFVNGSTKKKVLWSVACKTMLTEKNYASCELKLKSLKKKYIQVLLSQKTGSCIDWPYFELAHQAFHDDEYVINLLTQPQLIDPSANNPQQDDTNSLVVLKRPPTKPCDEKVGLMLQIYLRHKKLMKNVSKEYFHKNVWESIVQEMGETDAEYWHKRFLNYKQHYIRLLDRDHGMDVANTTWPYKELFDEIYVHDEEFQTKYHDIKKEAAINFKFAWNDTEVTTLVKYYFDSYDEFLDPTIPDNFLWNEIGRLLDKIPESCKSKYAELRKNHIDLYLEGGYDLRNRKAISIIFDNIIAKDVQLEIDKATSRKAESADAEMLDKIVNFFYDNVELFKDQICYFVCFAAVAEMVSKSAHTCLKFWTDLRKLYSSILDEKKDNPDSQIEWRYIDIFDRIFDYGMDGNLLKGYEVLNSKKTDAAMQEDSIEINGKKSYAPRKKGTDSDSITFKILEFYQKNKEKFQSTPRIKQILWETCSKQTGISATDCANKLRNLKTIYSGYVQKQVTNPETPIDWPYYQHCKKAFGYRSIKNKLKNTKNGSEDEEWSPSDIKKLIKFFAQNFNSISGNPDDLSLWTTLATELGKSQIACREKFMELRKSYRKLKTLKTKRSYKVTWPYFDLFDEIYVSEENNSSMEVDVSYQEVQVASDIKKELQDDDEIQCIIILPEGQDASDLSNAKITIRNTKKDDAKKWTKKNKRELLNNYLKYITKHKEEEIVAKDMWKEIATELQNKTPLQCRKMFAKLKNHHLNHDEIKQTSLNTILGKISAMKPKFKKIARDENKPIIEKVYKNVTMSNDKVEAALNYYLKNIEEFSNPQFDKKYVWGDLAKTINEPLSKIYHKLNFLKSNYSNTKDNQLPFANILKEILEKEDVIKANVLVASKDFSDTDDLPWSDDVTEQLLIWYLANLDKFKNPKYVRKYVWMEASNILSKSAVACLKKMSEIRTQYRSLVKESPDKLETWRFHELCQKIYGTGKLKA